jgi:porphobilinogen synthase
MNRPAIIGRLRSREAARPLTRETALAARRLLWPVFVAETPELAGPIAALPGVSRLTAPEAALAAAEAQRLGVGGVLLFGVTGRKDPRGSSADDPGAAVPAAIAAIKERAPGLAVLADVCLCQYTDTGACGIAGDPTRRRSATLARYAEIAAAYARAGADVVAPSGMADGAVASIRTALDAAGRGDVGVMGYSAKFASALYGPFRAAAGSAPASGHRLAHQLDPANAREALREAAADEAEGADVLMVKPAGAALDVLWRIRQQTLLPLAAYQVGGEYAMIRAAAERGWLDLRAAAVESLTAIARAGADLIITYFAADAARWLAEEHRA